MVELADTQVLGTCAPAYGFESHYPHQTFSGLIIIVRLLFYCLFYNFFRSGNIIKTTEILIYQI